MKFSIIIATKDAVRSLPKTLDSILSQKYSNYEVIIIDGVSEDGTKELIKDYENKLPGKLYFKSEPDRGIYDAMNKGIDAAQGEWLYFLGSGDVFFDEGVLEEVNKTIKNNREDVIYGDVQWGNSKKIYDGKFSRLKLLEKNICHQAIFYSRSVFKKSGNFELRYKIAADYVFNMKWFNDKGIKRRYIKKIIAIYNAKGVSSETYDKEFWGRRREIIKKYFPLHIIILRRVITILRPPNSFK